MPFATIPLWLPAGDTIISVRLSHPTTGSVRGGVVICPSLGREAVTAHDAFRLLAEDLAARGFAVLRIDWPGTGDSADPEDPETDLVPSWPAAVTAAATYLRSAGAPRVAVVGLRMGALLAVEAASSAGPFAAAVLWDLCRSGRTFLRQQTALAGLVAAELPGGAPVSGEQEVVGFDHAKATLLHLDELRLTAGAAEVAERVLVLGREEAAPASLAALVEGEGAEFEQVRGQRTFLDVSSVLSEMPESTLARIAAWLDEVTPEETSPATFAGSPTAVIDGRGTQETFCSLGPAGLFGVATQPPEPVGRPVLVFLNTAAEVHIGPGRVWVQTARKMAGLGWCSYRIDLSGLGDSPVRPGEPPRDIHGRFALQDVAEVVDAVAPGRPGDVVLIGLCSGAYAALAAGPSSHVGGVIAMNPVLEVRSGQLPEDAPEVRFQQDVDLEALKTERRVSGKALLRVPILKRFLRSLPQWMWHLLDVVGVQRSPSRGFAQVVDSMGDVLIVCGQVESHAYVVRGGWILERLALTGRFRFVRVDADHSLVAASGRRDVRALIEAHLVERYAEEVEPVDGPA